MQHMPHNTVGLAVVDGVATVTIDRPGRLNAMSVELMKDLSSAIAEVEADGEARVLVLTGAGRGFCSGADLSAAIPVGGGDGAGDPTAAMDRAFHPAIRSLHTCSVPTISKINGVAAGGGLGLAMTCDISIAARSAFFVATFGPRLGIVPDLGTTWHLPNRAGRARALGIAMLGDRFSADEAAAWGIIHRVVDDDHLDAEVERAAGILRRSSGEAMVRIRNAIDGAADRTLSEQLDVERDHQRILIPMNMAEGAAAFREQRDPDFGDPRG
jgi:2-(1,2-epoxy-1,2-dihydrophenyl)acetyl-CoA isomerase